MTWWRGYHGWKRKEARQWGMRWPVYHCVTARMKFWSLGNHHNPSNTVVLNNLYSERPCTKKKGLVRSKRTNMLGGTVWKVCFCIYLNKTSNGKTLEFEKKENTKGYENKGNIRAIYLAVKCNNVLNFSM